MSILSRIRSRFQRHDPHAPERLPSPDELVVLARPGGEPEALMLQELLAAQGIHALVRNRDAATARGGGWGPAWAYELCVLRRDLRRAREIVGHDDS
jgi:putative signal transducing protein